MCKSCITGILLGFDTIPYAHIFSCTDGDFGIVLNGMNVSSTSADHSGKSDASHLRQQWARHSKPKLQSPPTERYREDGLGESGREGSCKHQSCVPDTGAGVCMCVFVS